MLLTFASYSKYPGSQSKSLYRENLESPTKLGTLFKRCRPMPGVRRDWWFLASVICLRNTILTRCVRALVEILHLSSDFIHVKPGLWIWVMSKCASTIRQSEGGIYFYTVITLAQILIFKATPLLKLCSFNDSTHAKNLGKVFNCFQKRACSENEQSYRTTAFTWLGSLVLNLLCWLSLLGCSVTEKY